MKVESTKRVAQENIERNGPSFCQINFFFLNSSFEGPSETVGCWTWNEQLKERLRVERRRRCCSRRKIAVRFQKKGRSKRQKNEKDDEPARRLEVGSLQAEGINNSSGRGTNEEPALLRRLDGRKGIVVDPRVLNDEAKDTALEEENTHHFYFRALTPIGA